MGPSMQRNEVWEWTQVRHQSNHPFPLHYFSFPVIIILNDVFEIEKPIMFILRSFSGVWIFNKISYYFCLLLMLAGKKQLVIHKIMYFISWHSLWRRVLISASINDSDITAPNWQSQTPIPIQLNKWIDSLESFESSITTEIFIAPISSLNIVVIALVNVHVHWLDIISSCVIVVVTVVLISFWIP